MGLETRTFGGNRCKRRTDSTGTGGRKITPDAGWSPLQPPSAGFQRLYVQSLCAEVSRRLFQSDLAVRVFLPPAFIVWLKFRNDDARLLECSLAAPALPWQRLPKPEPLMMGPGISSFPYNAEAAIRRIVGAAVSMLPMLAILMMFGDAVNGIM